MQSVKVKVKRLVEGAQLPRYEHVDDSGLDLFAIAPTQIQPGETALVSTGIAIELPLGTEAQIRPRSGLALRHSITLLNTPGTIDAGYRGEIGVIVINHGNQPFLVTAGMKIAQMVIAPVLKAELEIVDSLSDSIRGEGGFGSTGI